MEFTLQNRLVGLELPFHSYLRNVTTIFFIYIDWTLEEIPRAFYVGKGVYGRVHKRERNIYWKNIVIKYGWRREVIFATKSESFAFEQEKRLIAELGTFEDGTLGCWGANLTEGGEGFYGGKHTTETREAIGYAQRGKPKSDETRRRMSEAWKGKPKSESTKRLLSKILTGRKTRPCSHETKEKISEANREHLAKLHESQRGVKRSEETKQRMKDAWVLRRSKSDSRLAT